MCFSFQRTPDLNARSALMGLRANVGQTLAKDFKRVVVHASAVLENSPFRFFIQKELISVVCFTTSKVNLTGNVNCVVHGQIASRDSGDGIF